jgi:hypothetical protein
VDATRVKLGKFSLRRLFRGAIRSLQRAQRRPLGYGPQAFFRLMEPSIAVEWGRQVGTTPLTLLGNAGVKTTLGDLDKALAPVARAANEAGFRIPGNLQETVTPGWAARAAGFTVGSALSYFGWNLTDALIGEDIGSPTVRKAVDGFGAGVTGLLADSGSQWIIHGGPIWIADGIDNIKASPAGPTLSNIVSRVGAAGVDLGRLLRIEDAVQAVRAGATNVLDAGRQIRQSVSGWLGTNVPAVSRAATAASNVVSPLAAPARAVSRVLRIGGPAGVVLAGAPDAWNASRAFWHDGMGSRQGWQSVGKGAVRVTLTAAGAAAGMSAAAWIGGLIGTAFLPGLGTAVGAIAGSVVGGLAADLINSRF